MADPVFRAGGLSSGIDTNLLIEKITEIESRPLVLIADRQASLNIQISTIGTLISRLDALNSTATSLKTSGVTSIGATGTYADFTVAGSAPNEGRFSIRVERLAKEAKFRMAAGLASASDAALVPDGLLTLRSEGTDYNVTITAAMTLNDVAAEINKVASPVVASVISDGTNHFLQVARRDTGHTGADVDFANALTVTADPGLGLANVQQAQNARLHVDGLEVNRTKNELTDVISGVTLTLKANSNVATDVVFTRSLDNTAANVQKFVDAYNSVAKLLQEQLKMTPGKSRTEDSIGGSALITLQQKLQNMLSKEVVLTGKVRTLGDLGVELTKDGTVALDRTRLDKALTNNPGAANQIFSDATSGIAKDIDDLVKKQNAVVDGVLTTRKDDIQKTIKSLDGRAEQIQRHITQMQARLVKQFTAMESIIGRFKQIGSFLDQQSIAKQMNIGK